MFTVCRERGAKSLSNVIPTENTMGFERGKTKTAHAFLDVGTTVQLTSEPTTIKFPTSTVITKAATEMEEGVKRKRKYDGNTKFKKKKMQRNKSYNDSFG